MSALLENAIVIDDCWNRIGVWGREQPRCPKLEQVVHCRNCAVYSESGRRILDRDIGSDYLREWTRIIAQPKASPRPDAETVVVFRIGEEWYALPARLVQEITEMRPIHRVPHRTGHILLGVTSIRGELKLCVSLGNMLGVEKGTYVEVQDKRRVYARLVVIDAQGGQLVFPVSDVLGTLRHHPGDLQNPPATVTMAKATYTKGMLEVDGRHIACLDAELLCYSLGRSLQ
jgi:chemotaxis-related protein WspD